MGSSDRSYLIFASWVPFFKEVSRRIHVVLTGSYPPSSEDGSPPVALVTAQQEILCLMAAPKTNQSASDETASQQVTHHAASDETGTAITPASAAAQVLASAKQSGLQILADAQAACEKLILIAEGDLKALLTEAEAGAIPLVLHNVPPPFASIVAPFAQVAASKLEGALNTAVEGAVTTGLGIAHNWLETVVASAAASIERLGNKA